MKKHGGTVAETVRGKKVGPCSFCPNPRVVLAVQEGDAMRFFCRRCVVELEVTGLDGIVRDPTDWPDLIGTEAN